MTTYTKRSDISTGVAGESVVQLPDGSLVAVSCAQLRCVGSQCTVYHPAARWIDEAGVTQTDAQGHEVRTQHRHTTSDDEMAAHGDDVKRACLFLVLGEPIPTTVVHELVPELDEHGDAVKNDAGEVVYKEDDLGNKLLQDIDYPIVPFAAEVLSTASIARAIAAAKATFETVDTADLL
jgi:hypothetical protein